MKLWTFQKNGHDIASPATQIQLAQSWFLNSDPRFNRKYEAVKRHCHTDQIIWCFTTEPEKWHHPGDAAWKLEVPNDKIVGFVDELLANHLLNNKKCPRIAIWKEWRQYVLSKEPYRQDRQDHLIDELIRTHPGAWIESAEAWPAIFTDPESSNAVSALLRRPIERKWVVGPASPSAS